MNRFLIISVLLLLLPGLIAACSPAIPQPAQSTQTAVKPATSTQAQVAAVDAQTPTTTAQPMVRPTPTPPPTLTGCPPPDGWSPYVIRPGDTLYTLAQQFDRTVEELMQVNCLTSSLISTGGILYLPLESCMIVSPSGWRLYAVRSGDTLFSLAATRDTTVDEVKRVNCLVSDSLYIGQQLYLPPLVLPPPPPPRAVQPATSSPSRFGMRSDRLKPFPYPSGGPNADPCANETKKSAWISDKTGNEPSKVVELGELVYFFACGFRDAMSLTAYLTGPERTDEIKVLPSAPDPDLMMDKAQGVAFWNATCDLQVPATYTLTMQDGRGTRAPSVTFVLTDTHFGRILATPDQSQPAGQSFQVYYCGYKTKSDQDLVIDLYYLANDGNFRGATSWTVRINSAGWTTETLTSNPWDLPGAYKLRVGDRDGSGKGLKGEVDIWLTR